MRSKGKVFVSFSTVTVFANSPIPAIVTPKILNVVMALKYTRPGADEADEVSREKQKNI